MKVCTKCGRELPLECFPNDKKGKCGKSSHCRDCRNEYYKKHYCANKGIVDEHKTHCAKCNVDTPYVLTFHHVDYRTKSFEISVANRKIKTILAELEKCICLCHNCHCTFHYFYGMRPIEPEKSLKEFLDPSWTPEKVHTANEKIGC